MLSVDEALRLVLEHAEPLPAVELELAGDRAFEDTREILLGKVLAESVVSDIDSPPRDKSIVDGYALIAADVSQTGVELAVLEEVTAGNVPTKTVTAGTATRIMTGAPIPAGADAVVMIEQTGLVGERVTIRQAPVKSGQNIMRRAASLSRGQTVLKAGTVLRPIELGILAEVGKHLVPVVFPPLVAILATGNELVHCSETPGPGQIRNSNGPLLCGLATQAGALPYVSEIIADDPYELSRAIEGVESPIFILSGGVSAGVLDLVPKVLRDVGVEEIFHKVDLKPGKPLWFGVARRENSPRQTLVFGLPGNPVSTLVCFELFVRPAIEKLSGRQPRGLPRAKARLTKEHKQRGDRPTYWPAAIAESDSGRVVTPLPWQGSGDLRTLTDANCLAFFPAGEKVFALGEEVTVLLLPEG